MTFDTIDYVGLGLLLGGALYTYGFIQRIKNGIRTTGIVIVNESEFSLRGTSLKKYYNPIVRLQINNQNLELKLNTGTNIPLYTVGDKIEVVYYQGKLHTGGFGSVILSSIIMMIGIAIILLNNL
ncbi:MAG: hypothetical protein U0U66_05400 [Cytophagaceae bacterium]